MRSFLLAPPGLFERRLAALVTCGLLLLTLGSFLSRNRALVAGGGDDWTHGEWLISFAAGPVRRGLSGEIFLALSDLTGLSPVVLVEIAQGGALAALVVTVIWAVSRIGAHERLLICLASPAFILMWHNDFGSHGKEIVACLPYLPLVIAAGGRMRPQVALAVSLVLFAFAALMHETAIFHIPALALAAWALTPGRASAAFVITATGLSLVLVATIMLGGPLETAEPLCTAITERGVPETVCGTPFEWTVLGTEQALAFTLDRLPDREWGGIAATFLLAYLPLAVAVHRSPRRKLWYALFAISFLGYLPLYAVAIDYGRWLNMQASGITLALVVAVASGWDDGIRASLSRLVFAGLFALGLLWRVSMVSGGIGSGVLEPVVKAVLGIS